MEYKVWEGAAYSTHFCACWLLSHVWLFVIPWNLAHQALLSMEFSRQQYWSGLPFPSAGNFPDPGIEPGSSAEQAGSLPSELAYGTHLKFHIVLWKIFCDYFHVCAAMCVYV